MEVVAVVVVVVLAALLASALPAAQALASPQVPTYLVLGGTGRIGTAVAIHLINRSACNVVLAGRTPASGKLAVDEVCKEVDISSESSVSYAKVSTVWEPSEELRTMVDQADCVIHTAGPYMDRKPVPLELSIASKRCRAYVDVSDPLPYLEASLLMDEQAKQSGTVALLAAGAFPGMSNVLATEAARSLSPKPVQDVRFNYFTAGLGGSGVVNLYITNIGFGEPMPQYDGGQLRFFQALSGSILGKVDFFLPESVMKNSGCDEISISGNERSQRRIGSQSVFSWPFPEAATAPKIFNARGNSYAAMGTSPDVWNVMLGVLVQLVPRPWWRNEKFSKFLADFSEPLVLATDALLKLSASSSLTDDEPSTSDIGETHAMRIDVTSGSGKGDNGSVSIVQAHESFRRCVGQSCAEFALDIMDKTHSKPGVYLPEQYFQDDADRKRILERLSTTPGTFCYTGPVRTDGCAKLPTKYNEALQRAEEEEATPTFRD